MEISYKNDSLLIATLKLKVTCIIHECFSCNPGVAGVEFNI